MATFTTGNLIGVKDVFQTTNFAGGGFGDWLLCPSGQFFKILNLYLVSSAGGISTIYIGPQFGFSAPRYELPVEAWTTINLTREFYSNNKTLYMMPGDYLFGYNNITAPVSVTMRITYEVYKLF